MAANIEETIIEKVRALPPEKQREILEFVETVESSTPPQKSIWEKIEERVNRTPREAWADAPTDASINVDHYLYGAPKK